MAEFSQDIIHNVCSCHIHRICHHKSRGGGGCRGNFLPFPPDLTNGFTVLMVILIFESTVQCASKKPSMILTHYISNLYYFSLKKT